MVCYEKVFTLDLLRRSLITLNVNDLLCITKENIYKNFIVYLHMFCHWIMRYQRGDNLNPFNVFELDTFYGWPTQDLDFYLICHGVIDVAVGCIIITVLLLFSISGS